MTRGQMLYRRLNCHVHESEERVRTRALFKLGASREKISAHTVALILDAVIAEHKKAQKLAREFGL